MKRLAITASALLLAFAAASAASTDGTGNLLSHISFDDSANPLKAEVGKDAFEIHGKGERVTGLAAVKHLTEGGDGGVTVPLKTSIAIPVPDVLAKESGHPYSVLLKLKLHGMAFHPILNMPADKMGDALVNSSLYGRLFIAQHEKSISSRGGYGVVPQSKIIMLLLCFGADSTTAFIDGKQIFSTSGLIEGKLAGSRADCSKAGGNFLLRGLAEDFLPADITFYDVKIYDGVVDPRDEYSVGKKTPAENAGGAENKNSPPNTTSPSPVATPTANNPVSPAGNKNGQTDGETKTNGGGSFSQEGGVSGSCLCHISFDDSANPLKAEVGKDAVVRRNRAEKVSGMGEVKWEANGGDGAVAIPIGWHIAVPVPDVLTKEPGLPFSVSMKVKFSQFARDTYPSLLNMPADNGSPGMLYLVIDSQYVDPVICVKQWNKNWGAGEKGKGGFTAEKWENVLAVFDRDKTEVFLNGNKIISCNGKLAGSYADCSKAGGYILLSADPAPSGGTIYWADLKIYAGADGTGGGTSTHVGGGTSSSGGGSPSQGGGATTPAESAGKETPSKNPDAKTGQNTGKSGSTLTTEEQREIDYPKGWAVVGSWPFGSSMGRNMVLDYDDGEVIGAKRTYNHMGIRKEAHHFDGAKHDTVKAGNVEILNKVVKAVTISGWIRPEKWCNGKLPILAKGEKSRHFSFIIRQNRFDLCDTKGMLVETTESVTLGEWQHVAITYNGVEIRAFRNGRCIGAKKASGSLDVNNEPLFFARDYFGDKEDYTGDLYDIQITTRAYSTKEIVERWQGTGGGLIAYFPFDGNAKDLTGNGWHGEVLGATLTADMEGKPNRAYHFDGSSAIRIPLSGIKDSLFDSMLTVSAWIRPEKWRNGWLPIVSAGESKRHYGLIVGNKPNFVLNDLNSTSVDVSEGIRLGEWQHLAISYHKGEICAFRNGRCIGTKKISHKGLDLLVDVFIGRDSIFGGFTGDIDEVSIHNIGYGQGQINNIYQSIARTGNNPTNPVTSTDQGDGSQGGGNNGGGGSVTPSTEVQQMLETFSADNGLSAAEKIPALKAYIETHLDEPGIEKLIDLLEELAKEANDEETLKWVEEIRKKLADRKSGTTAQGEGGEGGVPGAAEPGAPLRWYHRQNAYKNLGWDLPPEQYTFMGEPDTIKVMYHKGKAGGVEDEYLIHSQNRLDGWFKVTKEQAGAWKFRQNYDDYMALDIDGKRLIANKDWRTIEKADWTATEGWHKFMIVYGDAFVGIWGRVALDLDAAIMVAMNGGAEVPFEDAVEFHVAKAQEAPGVRAPAAGDKGLVAYWPFDGSAHDVSGNGHHGTVRGASLTADRKGRVNSAYHFEASDYACIRVPNSPALEKIERSVTIAAWVKPEKLDHDWVPIAIKGAHRYQFGLNVEKQNKFIMCSDRDIAERNVYVKAATTLKLGEWQHVAVTCDGAKMKVFINGKCMGVRVANTKFPTNNDEFFIGRDHQADSKNYTGDIDEFCIYSRALSDEEVSALCESEPDGGKDGVGSGGTGSGAGGGGDRDSGSTETPPAEPPVQPDAPKTAGADGLPSIKLYTVAEADEAQKRVGRPLRPRRKRTLSLALPVAEDGFFDNLTSRSAIINVRETIRDLVSPLEGEEEKIFNRKWDAVIEYPAPNIVEWLKKVAPIASEMVRIKAFVDANVIEWSDVYDEANLARTFGAFEEAENLVAEAADIADALDAAKARMAELQAKLEELGEMPDPIEEKAAARKRHKEAVETVRKAFGKKSDSEIPEGIAEYAGVYMTGRWALLGTPDVRMHFVDLAAGDEALAPSGRTSYSIHGGEGAYLRPAWRSDMLSIEPVFYDEDTKLVLLKLGYMNCIREKDEKFFVDYAFAKDYGYEGLFFFMPAWGDEIRTISECEEDNGITYCGIQIEPQEGGIRLRYLCQAREQTECGKTRFVTRTFRKVKSFGEKETAGFHFDDPELDAKLVEKWHKNIQDYLKSYERAQDILGEFAGKTKLEKLPLAENLYRVLERTEFKSKEVPYVENPGNDEYHPQPDDRLVKSGWSGANDFYRKMAEKAAGKIDRYNDTARAYVYWVTACDYGESRFAYRYNGSIYGYLSKGRNAPFKLISGTAYDKLSFTVVGRWLPPKPVAHPWEQIGVAVHQTCENVPAAQLEFNDGGARLDMKCGHYTQVIVDEEYESKNLKYYYEPPGAYANKASDARFTHERFPSFTTGAMMMREDWGEKNDGPQFWVYPESTFIFTVGLEHAPGFSSPWSHIVNPDNKNVKSAGVHVTYHFKIREMDGDAAKRLAKELGEKYYAAAAKEWGENVKAPEGFDLAAFSSIDPPVKEESSDEKLAQFEEPQKTKEEIAAEEEAKKERIEFHKENIKFIEGTISRLKGELAKEEDASRRSAIEWSIKCQESNKIYEQDRIRAEETGEFHASRTPFDEMCRQQVFESAIREVQTEDYLLRERKKVYAFLDRTGPHAPSDEEKERIWRRLDAMDTKDPVAAAKELNRISSNLLGHDVESTMNRVYTLEDKELMYSDLLLRAERTKMACDIALALGGIAISGGVAAGELAPTVLTKFTVLRYSYAMGCGYIESGPSGILKGVVTTYSDLVDIVWSGVDGYREGKKTGHPYLGFVKGAGWSFVLNKGLPWVMGKVNWRKQITFGKAPKMAEPKIELDALATSGKIVDADGPKVKVDADGPKVQADSPDVAAYKAEVGKAHADIEAFMSIQKKCSQFSELDVKKGLITQAQYDGLQQSLRSATAKINANPTAKAMLKYDAVYKELGVKYVTELDKIHDAVMADFYKDMEAKGFSPETIEAVRNSYSGKSVGMDSDFGLVEPENLKDLKIVRDGKRVSAYDWMKEAQSSWNAKYEQHTGQSAKRSWENITTHSHPEAYLNKGILEINVKEGPDALSKMNDLLDRMSLSDAQQISDVTLFKADEMLKGTEFPRLVYVREAARGTAKDMGSKFLPALDSKIKPLEKLELSLTKQGKALSKSQQHELNRLRAAREHYGSIYDTLDKIGRGEMDPSKWDDAINSLAGGQGIRQMIVDMGDLFKFLAL